METPSAEFQVYPKRFGIVFLFSLIQMMTSCLMNTLTPIASYLALIYHEDPVVVNLGGLLFTLMHPIFTFPAAYVIDTYGARVGIITGCVLCLVGTCVRMLINEAFVFVIIGQVIAGIGRPFILNCQTKISANWFTAESRGGVTQLLTLVLNVSLILGIFIPGIVFGDYKPDMENPASVQEGKDLTFKLMWVEVVMAACCYLPNIIFQEEKPPTAPSDSVNVVREPFKTALPKLFCNKNYLLLLIAFGCYFGIFNGLSIILSYLIEPWFGGEDLPLAVGCVGGSPIISGIIGVLIIGPMQRKSGEFKKWIVLCMLGTTETM
jgi:FLVCR family feline leukemia virus subgroup C receptor-related protein